MGWQSRGANPLLPLTYECNADDVAVILRVPGIGFRLPKLLAYVALPSISGHGD